MSHRTIRRKNQLSAMMPSLGTASWAFSNDDTAEMMTAPAAVESGADILLTGWGGDNAASYKGHGVRAALLRQFKFSALREFYRHDRARGEGALKPIIRILQQTLLPPGSTLREALLGRRRDTRGLNARLLSGLRPSAMKDSPLGEQRTHDTQRNRIIDIMSPVLSNRLEILACHGLRCGIRYVHPLLDRRLLSHALTCPPEFEFRDGWFRAPMRAAIKGIVPDAIRLRATGAFPHFENPLDVARHKEWLLEKLAELEKDDRLTDTFDFALIKRHLSLQPTPEEADAWARTVAETGTDPGFPMNLSANAVGAISAYQAALDGKTDGEWARLPDGSV